MAGESETFSFGLTLDLIGEEVDHLSLREFSQIIGELGRILRALEHGATEQSVPWSFDADPVFRVFAHANGVASDALGTIVATASDGFRQMAEPNAALAQLTPSSVYVPTEAQERIASVINRLRRIADLEVTATGRPSVYIAHDSGGSPSEAPAFFYEESEVDGHLDIINVHGAPHFVLFEHGTGNRVRCSLPDHMLKDAKDALRGRVVAEGLVKYRQDGTPVAIRNVNRIEAVPEPQAHITDLRGKVPGITGDVGSGEFVRRLRSPDDEEE